MSTDVMLATVEALHTLFDLGILLDEGVEARAEAVHVVELDRDGGSGLALLVEGLHLPFDLGVRPIHLAVIDVIDSADVLQDPLDLGGPERRDTRDVVLTEIASKDVLDAIDVLEIQVDVGSLDPIEVDETLEHQLVFDRIDVRDARQVTDERSRSGSAAWADEHLLASGIADVPDDEEVVREALLLDDSQLVSQALDVAIVALEATTLQALPR